MGTDVHGDFEPRHGLSERADGFPEFRVGHDVHRARRLAVLGYM